jgi:hypothetical protein
MKVRTPSVAVLGVALLVLSSVYLVAQVQQARGGVAQEPPGGITLLQGYQHERLRGADSRVGRITNGRGFEIRYDIGGMAGNRATNPRGRLWLKEQVIAGNQLQISFTMDRVLNVALPATPGGRGGPGSTLPANFFGTVTSEEEVVDLLLTAMSYKP